MNPRDAQSLGLKPHERVDVISARGRVKSVELRVTEIIAPGQVFMPFTMPRRNAQSGDTKRLRSKSRGSPITNSGAVRIERH